MIKLLNIAHLAVRSTAWTVLDGLFSRLAQSITKMKGRGAVARAMTFDLTCIFKVIQLWLCNKTAIICHVSSCLLNSTCSCKWIPSIFGTLVWEDLSHNDLWPKYCNFVYLWRCLYRGLYSFVAPMQPMRGRCVTYHFQVSRSRFNRPLKFVRGGGWACILVDH